MAIATAQDLQGMQAAFNSVRGDARYNPRYDLNNDGRINMQDYLLLTQMVNEGLPFPTGLPASSPVMQSPVAGSLPGALGGLLTNKYFWFIFGGYFALKGLKLIK